MDPFRRVLIVDDDDANRITLAALLEEAGCTVAEAGSLAEARVAIGGGRAATIVVLDVGLPDGSGLSLVPELNAAWPEARVVVVSGEVPERIAGVSACLAKGGDPDDVVRAVLGDGVPRLPRTR